MQRETDISKEIKELGEIIKGYEWVKCFEQSFKSYLKEKNQTYLNIIVGKSPYEQGLNNIDFKVTNLNYPYSKLGKYVAFFVNDWIKIQDSLEMICNLIFNGSVNSLKALYYLREKNIKSNQFANYLFYNYGIILTNISNQACCKTYDNADNIRNIINDLNRKTNLLIAGDDAEYGYNRIIKNYINNSINKHIYRCIHPSGVNLNNCSSDYYKNWYTLIDRNNNSLQHFSIFN